MRGPRARLRDETGRTCDGDDVVNETFLVAWRRLDAVPEEPGLSETYDIDDEISLRVRQALARLGERDRELLMLIAWEGLRVNEAAEALGVHSGTLGVRLHRARKRLADALATEDVEFELEVGR